MRKIRTLALVARRRRHGPETPDHLAESVTGIRDSALAGGSLYRKVTRLWAIEGLTFAYCDRNWRRESAIPRLRLPLEAGPPAHCGLAMAAVLADGFDRERLSARFDASADPRFVRFCHETVGLMLAIYQRDAMGFAASVMGRLGLVRHRPVQPPRIRPFLEALPEDRRRLAAHGIGRAVYFKEFGLARGVAKILKTPGLPVAAALSGMCGAEALVNCRDLEWLVNHRIDAADTDIARGVRGGLVNTLTLLEWTVPNCLDDIPRHGILAEEATLSARTRARSAREAGLAPPLVA